MSGRIWPLQSTCRRKHRTLSKSSHRRTYQSGSYPRICLGGGTFLICIWRIELGLMSMHEKSWGSGMRHIWRGSLSSRSATKKKVEKRGSFTIALTLIIICNHLGPCACLARTLGIGRDTLAVELIGAGDAFDAIVGGTAAARFACSITRTAGS